MKKSIVFVLVIITAMVLSMGLLTCSAAPETTPAPAATATPEATPEATPAQEEQAPPIIETKISLDGSVEASFVEILPKGTVESTPNIVDMAKQQLKDSGYDVELIDVDNSKALKYSIKTKPGEKFVYGPPAVMGVQGFDSFSTKGFFGTTFVATSREFDLTKQPESLKVVKIIFDAPVGAKFSNAPLQENGGKLSTWDVKGGGSYAVQYIVTVPNMLNIAIVILILILIIFIIFMVILSNKKKAKKALADLSEEEYNVESDDIVAVDSQEDPFAEMSQEEIDTDIEETDK